MKNLFFLFLFLFLDRHSSAAPMAPVIYATAAIQLNGIRYEETKPGTILLLSHAQYVRSADYPLSPYHFLGIEDVWQEFGSYRNVYGFRKLQNKKIEVTVLGRLMWFSYGEYFHGTFLGQDTSMRREPLSGDGRSYAVLTHIPDQLTQWDYLVTVGAEWKATGRYFPVYLNANSLPDSLRNWKIPEPLVNFEMYPYEKTKDLSGFTKEPAQGEFFKKNIITARRQWTRLQKEGASEPLKSIVDDSDLRVSAEYSRESSRQFHKWLRESRRCDTLRYL